MKESFSERRFSDEELSRILEEATRSEAQSQNSAPAQGHTLAEIREIAREAGIDPAAVDRAAARLVASPPDTALRAGHGNRVSRTVHVERVISRPLANGEMRSIPQLVEVVMNRSGKARAWGDWVEWRDDGNRLYLGVVRGEGQTRIRAIADSFHDVFPGFFVIGLVSVLIIGAAESVPLIFPVLVLAVLAGERYWRWHCNKTRRILNDLLDILQDRLDGGDTRRG